MPIQPPAGAFKASAWLPTVRIRLPPRPTLNPYARQTTHCSMSTDSDTVRTGDPSTPSSGQTWKSSNGFAFGRTAVTSTIPDRTWNPSFGITFTSPGATPLISGPQMRRMHSDGERSGRGASLSGKPRRPRRVRTEGSSKARSLSHCAALGEVSFESIAACREDTFGDGMFENQSLELGATVRSIVYTAQEESGTTVQRTLNMTRTSVVRDEEIRGQETAVEQEEAVVGNLLANYQIAEEDFQAARESGHHWTYGLYRNAEGLKPTMHYCRKKDASEAVAKQFLDENVKIVGFDLEWKAHHFRGRSSTSIKDNVSLIQIASESRVAIFQIALHRGQTAEELLAPSLRRILEDPSIVKVGVNINADCTRLSTFLGVDVRSRFELSHIHKLVLYSGVDHSRINRKLVSLDKLVETHLGLPLYKGDVRTGAWERELDKKQLVYAASDAYAGVQLYGVLDAKRRALRPTPPMPLPAEMKVPIRVVALKEIDGSGGNVDVQQVAVVDDEANVDGEEDDAGVPLVDESAAGPGRSQQP